MAYQNLNNHTDALKSYKKYITTRDSILNENNRNEIIKQEYKYNYEKKVAANKAIAEERLKQEEDKRIILYFGFLILVLLIVFISYRYKVSREQQKVIKQTLTNLKQTQNQLIQSEKMAALGVLTAGIAHEINNPVNFIKGSIDALSTIYKRASSLLIKIKELPEKDKNSDEYYDAITKLNKQYNIDEAIQLIPEFLDGANIGVERTTEILRGLMLYSYKKEEVLSENNLHKNLDSTLTLLKFKYKGRIEIVKNYDNSISSIKCFPSSLNQVFINIISNAIDAILKKGSITITTKEINNIITISIKDDGQGIPKHIIPKIFDPLYTTKQVGKGTGLGLSICQGIIKNHDGKIEVFSEKEKGSEFKITLPKK